MCCLQFCAPVPHCILCYFVAVTADTNLLSDLDENSYLPLFYGKLSELVIRWCASILERMRTKLMTELIPGLASEQDVLFIAA
jgi:hypothetical protein